MNVVALITSARWADALTVAVKVLRELDVDDVAVVARRDVTDEDSLPMIVRRRDRLAISVTDSDDCSLPRVR